jgi:hypothetical protein
MVPHWFFDYAAATIVVCSILHTFLPPWEFLNDFPTAQKYYKAGVYLIGYIAGNARSSVYKSLSTKEGSSLSQVVQKKNGGIT